MLSGNSYKSLAENLQALLSNVTIQDNGKVIVHATNEKIVAEVKGDGGYTEAKSNDDTANQEIYNNLLRANRHILKKILTYFYSDDFTITDENTLLVLQMVFHFCYQNKVEAGELLYKFIINGNKTLISNEIIDNGAIIDTTVPARASMSLTTSIMININMTTLYRALYSNISLDTIARLVPKSEEFNVSAMLMVTSRCDESTIAYFLKLYPESIAELRKLAKLRKAISKPLGISTCLPAGGDSIFYVEPKKASMNLLAAMHLIEKPNSKISYSKEDKTLFLDYIGIQLEKTKSIEECFKLYDKFICSQCINYHSNYSLTKNYNQTKIDLILAIQQKIHNFLFDANFLKQSVGIYSYFIAFEKTLKHPVFAVEHEKCNVPNTTRLKIETERNSIFRILDCPPRAKELENPDVINFLIQQNPEFLAALYKLPSEDNIKNEVKKAEGEVKEGSIIVVSSISSKLVSETIQVGSKLTVSSTPQALFSNNNTGSNSVANHNSNNNSNLPNEVELMEFKFNH